LKADRSWGMAGSMHASIEYLDLYSLISTKIS
jgi:hypothetical protein